MKLIFRKRMGKGMNLMNPVWLKSLVNKLANYLKLSEQIPVSNRSKDLGFLIFRYPLYLKVLGFSGGRTCIG